MDNLEAILNQTFLGISLERYAAAFTVLVLALVLRKVLAHLFTAVIFPFAKKTDSRYDDIVIEALRKPAMLLVFIAGLFVAIQILQLPTEPTDLRHFAFAVLKVLITFAVALACYNLVSLLDEWIARWVNRTESTLDDHLAPFVRKSLRVFIVFIAVLMAIQNLGYSISGLLASLGIGGLAVALAAKDTLANVFGSVMIILDRPFHIGDWVKTKDLEGIVEEVGFRSTKIRTLDGSLISVPNSTITNMAIDNCSRMTARRIRMTIGVTYETTPDQLRQAVEMIRTMLASHGKIDPQRVAVRFTDFGASSLDILVNCFTGATATPEYLAVREEVCLRIMEIFEKAGVEIAFPSRSLYLRGKERDLLPMAASEREMLEVKQAQG
jgi:MscS family membrane protein